MEEVISTRYNIIRQSFDTESGTFGKVETIVNASEKKKSASFPRISPDGRFLVFTLHDYGTFPMWHREADLHILNLRTGESRKMELNSNETESYHTWSSNGSWLVFSSKRTDGRSTRPFMAYIDSLGHSGKPFILPQKDPARYDKMLE
jgi:Tol biopolymer transport system component